MHNIVQRCACHICIRQVLLNGPCYHVNCLPLTHKAHRQLSCHAPCYLITPSWQCQPITRTFHSHVTKNSPKSVQGISGEIGATHSPFNALKASLESVNCLRVSMNYRHSNRGWPQISPWINLHKASHSPFSEPWSFPQRMLTALGHYTPGTPVLTSREVSQLMV